MSLSTSDDGRQVVHPNLVALGSEALVVWTKRLGEVTHPAIVARYADVLWDLTTTIDPNAKRNYKHGQMAVDAYLRLSKEKLCRLGIESALALQRALEIATELNDSGRIDAVATNLLALATSADLASIGIWIMPAKAFDGNRKINEAHRRQLTGELERRLEEARKECNGYAANAACEELLKFYKRDLHREDRVRVVQIMAETYIRQSENADAGVAIAWLSPVAHLLEAEGLNADAEKVRLIMEKRGPEAMAGMKTLSVEVPIDIKALDQFLGKIISVEHPFLALLRLALHLIPHCDHLRKQVKQHEKQFVFYSLAPRTIIGRDGLPKASIGSSEDDLEGRMLEEATTEFQLASDYFARGYQKVKDKFAFTSQDLINVVSSCSLVSEDALNGLREGITAYGDGDFYKALSILIPVVEAMLRELLKLLDVPVRKGVRGHDGMTELKNMNDVLSDVRVEETLEEDLLFFLRALYIDKRSYNLRNEFAHGALPAGAFNLRTASLVIMSLVLLAVIGPHGVYLDGDESATRQSSTL